VEWSSLRFLDFPLDFQCDFLVKYHK